MGLLSPFRKQEKSRPCPVCHQALDDKHDAQFRIPVKGGVLALADLLIPVGCHTHQASDLDSFETEVISRGDTKAVASETLEYLLEVGRAKAGAQDWDAIKSRMAGKHWSDWRPYLRYVLLLPPEAGQKAQQWVDERYAGGVPAQTTEDLIGMLGRERTIHLSQNFVDRLADLGETDALAQALRDSCEYRQVRMEGVKDLKATLLTVELSGALARTGEEKGLEAMDWVMENAGIASGAPFYWLRTLEDARKWNKIVADGDLEAIHAFLEELAGLKLFDEEGESRLLKYHNRYREWRLCAYLLKTRGDERTVPLLEKLGAVVDFYEKPRVARLVSLIRARSR